MAPTREPSSSDQGGRFRSAVPHYATGLVVLASAAASSVGGTEVAYGCGSKPGYSTLGYLGKIKLHRGPIMVWPLQAAYLPDQKVLVFMGALVDGMCQGLM